MGMYCCCGVRKRDPWVCECDWDGWSLCFQTDHVPDSVPIQMPTKNGTYIVRVFEDADNHETQSQFSLIQKNWGEPTNKAISHWSITYNDHWTGFRGVYAWKEMQ